MELYNGTIQNGMFTYLELIGAYFDRIKKSFRRFSTAGCRKYVMHYRKDKFDEEKFKGYLAMFLATADEELSDYSDVEQCV